MQSNDIYKKITDAVDIVEVISEYLKLNKRGQNFFGLCPFHSDTNPSLSISKSKNIFKCFVCNEKGNVISFVSKFNKISYFEAALLIAKKFLNDSAFLSQLNSFKKSFDKFEEVHTINDQATDIYHKTLFNKSSEGVLKYLTNERKLTKEIIQEYKIGYSTINKDKKYLLSIMTNENEMLGKDRDPSLVWTLPKLLKTNLIYLNDDNNYNDYFVNRVVFPIKTWNGKISGFSGRDFGNKSNAKYLISKSAEHFQKNELLFNFSNFDKSKFDEIYLVEGYMDALSMRVLNIENVVAIMGIVLSDFAINIFKKYQNLLVVNLCFDNDDAGRNATLEIGKKLIKHNFSVFVVEKFDSKIKDVNDLLINYGQEKSLELIKKQIPFTDFLINFCLNANMDEKSKTKNLQMLLKHLKEIERFITINTILIKIEELLKIDRDDLKSMYDRIVLEKNEQNSFTSNFNQKNIVQEKPKFKKQQEEIEYSELNDFEYEEKEVFDYSNLIDEQPAYSFEKDIFIQASHKNASLKEQKLIELILFNFKLMSGFFDYYIGTLFFLREKKNYREYKNIVAWLGTFYAQTKLVTDYDEKNYHIDFLTFIKKRYAKSGSASLVNMIQQVLKKVYGEAQVLGEKNLISQGFEIMLDLYSKIIIEKRNEIVTNKELDVEEKRNQITSLEKTQLRKKELIKYRDILINS